jgi:bifunctional ADP-heptose synthase (sugar kinase/adenylyltransferase)
MILNLVDQFIDDVKDLRVAVIGETITDEFIFVSYEGPSMKSLCPVLKLENKREVHQGGAKAIANHIRDFVKSVDLISNEDSEIVKTRYVDIGDNKKHIEINNFSLKNNQPLNIDTSKYDVVIVADFGHGYCDNINITDGFYLMCQTNSNNFGYNRISKWKNLYKKAICIDLREASLQLNKKAKFGDIDEVNELYNYELNTENLFVTLGSRGSLHFNGVEIIREESFKSKIVDTIGAGDTFFGFVSLATASKNIKNILTIPSLAASLSTTWLGNEQFVTKEKLKKYATKFI